MDLTIVVPTFNEAENVPLLVAALHRALDDVCVWEAVFVDDDSPDGTAEVAKSIARTDRAIRCIHRLGRRGLSSACLEGALSSAAPHVAVMDADLQHDESILPAMWSRANTDNLDVVVGSRHVPGGGVGDWAQDRQAMSRFATGLAKMATKVALSDPMSGFFVIRREVITTLAPRTSAIGFKILLDVLASAPQPLRVAEVPYQFRVRQHGDSKLDSQAAWDFLMLLADKTIGRFVPVRFLSFAAIGGTGIGVHLAMFYLVTGLGQSFEISKLVAVLASIVSNFTLNNLITYRDRRYTGWRWVTGLATFMAVCSVGAIADIGISSYIYETAEAGSLMRSLSIIPVVAGILVAAVWNYAVSSVYTWRPSGK